MSDATTTRISRATHDELRTLAASSGMTVSDTLDRALRPLHQEQIGQGQAAPLTDSEIAWQDADAG